MSTVHHAQKPSSTGYARREKALACPVCDATDTFVCWTATEVPVFCNVLCPSRDDALRMPHGDIHLAFCPRCGLLHNDAFDPQLVPYGGNYENALHYSHRFRAYIDQLAHDLVERYALRGKTVLEIACGDGTFLHALCQRGGNRGIGLDPSHSQTRHRPDGGGDVQILAEPYCAGSGARDADLVCCRQALEHIAQPLELLRTLRRELGNRRNVVVFFEVPNALYTIRQMGIWDLIYEHCNYFVADSLRYAFEAAGFRILRTAETYDGQFLTIEVTIREDATAPPGSHTLSDGDLHTDVERFAARYARKREEWRVRLAEIQARRRRVVVWGAGSKGVTFLNVVPGADVVEYVVDVNPRKHGMHVAGTGQTVVEPAFLQTWQPDGVIVMNSVYLTEIRLALRALNVRCDIQTA